jgi:DNA-binding HxlR family transcriptional regulator
MAKTICPIRILLDQFSDRWAVLAILSIKEGPVRFNVLRRSLDGIAQKVSGQTLQRLAQNGFVERSVLATKPIAV